jgi:hypothetical protein
VLIDEHHNKKNPGGGKIFRAHVQTGPGAHPASLSMGTGSFPGVKRPGRGAALAPLLAPKSRWTDDGLLRSKPVVVINDIQLSWTER